MTVKDTAGRDARRLLLNCYDGVLSTNSALLAGYPFGSVVPFCLDRAGRPVILIADIAQHTRNITADPRVSLIVFERTAADLQLNGRYTAVADAVPVPPDDKNTQERYYRYFPDSRDYHLTHSFMFFALAPKRIRYIGGFGDIHWLEPAQTVQANPFDAALEQDMIEHMNADHVDAMRRYIAPSVKEDPATLEPRMTGIDAEGCHVRVNGRIVRIPFAEPATTPQDVRAALVALARR
ncbi:MAG: HugZ family protein [Gammaproteobacteria bacterium]|nr:HugZ family protein [Gammaproteobacteria bacterium]MBI5618009.1 HugZ family protein [Gammaproteobacteria bacterium]